MEANIIIIRPLLRICSLLAITPNFDIKTERRGTGIIYTYFVISSLLALSIYTILARFMYEKHATSATYHFLSLISYSMLCISNVSSCVNICLKNGKKFAELITGFIEIDRKFKNYPRKKQKLKFRTEMLLYYSLYVVHIVYLELYMASTKNGFKLYDFTRRLQTVHNLSVALLIYNIGLHFRDRFSMLNARLETSRQLNYVGQYKVAEVNNGYVKLAEMVNWFNEIFGLHVLYLSANFVLGLLFCINLAIMEMSEKGIEFMNVHFWMNIAVMCVCILVLCVPFASSCNAAAQEAKTTSILCYALLSQLGSKEKSSRRELKLLASIDSPTFSAAGFFTVDHTMLFTLFGAVTSYLIVLIQLKDMQI